MYNSVKVAGEKSPWHCGERTMQSSVGLVEKMEQIGRKVIRPYMPDQHRDFFNQLPFVVAGAIDENNDAWATLLVGRPGFISSPSDTELRIDVDLEKGDPAKPGFADNSGIGLLGIELHTRRRNRVNGIISDFDSRGFMINVAQSMGNCPKYIQLRHFDFADDPDDYTSGKVQVMDRVDTEAAGFISNADTFFVASYADVDGKRQVDVSHRGGKPGFVRVGDDGILTIPDFSGNNFFNTLGNICLNSKAGLIFVNFESGDVMQMTGVAEIVLHSEKAILFDGVERLWTFRPTQIVKRKKALPLRWAYEEQSPALSATGSWEAATKKLLSNNLSNQWEPYLVIKIVNESDHIRSIYLESVDRTPLKNFKAGQHLPIRLDVPGYDEPLSRTYTLSSAPTDGIYRISVKREGLVSGFLHDQLSEGDIINARPPQGAFTLKSDMVRPIVMLAGGVGITPMISMIGQIFADNKNSQVKRTVWLFHAVRHLSDLAFYDELNNIVYKSGGMFHLIRTLSDLNKHPSDIRFHKDRINMELLKSVLPFDDYDFYLCGPSGFMQSLYDGLRELNISDKQIFAESFGPSSLLRINERVDPETSDQIPAVVRDVLFEKSNVKAKWDPGSRSLLELAEMSGLTPSYGCRTGSCGTCATKVLEGDIAYSLPPLIEVRQNEALICCAVPADISAERPDELILDL